MSLVLLDLQDCQAFLVNLVQLAQLVLVVLKVYLESPVKMVQMANLANLANVVLLDPRVLVVSQELLVFLAGKDTVVTLAWMELRENQALLE